MPVRRSWRGVPLLISGGIRRFAEDPWRGWSATVRAVPALRRWDPAVDKPLTRVERAAAEDRLEDARDAAVSVVYPADHVAASLAIRRLSGDLADVAATTPQSRAQRRQVRAAQREAEVLRDALPSWVSERESRPKTFGDDGTGRGRGDRGTQGAPLRIMHVVTNALPHVQAGSTIRTHRVANAQQERGWQVAVATRPGFPVFHGEVLPEVDRWYDGVHYLPLLPAWMPAPTHIPSVYAHLLHRQVERWKPHVLHGASDHINARAALEVGRRIGLPVAYEARTLPEESWLSKHGGDEARGSDAFRWMHERHREVLLAADAVTTLGESMREALCEQGVDPERIFVVPNGVPEEYVTTSTPQQVARERKGIEGGDLLLGTVTTMYSYEGLGTIIRTAQVLRQQGLDARVLLVGDGPERTGVIGLADELGVPYHAPGRVPVGQVLDYLDALDVFLLPRRSDPITARVTALKPLEAQARGVPVVGSDLPAVAEVLGPGSALVAGDDPREWASAVGQWADLHRRQEAGVQAREWVRACRTWPSVMAGYANAYAFLGVDGS